MRAINLLPVDLAQSGSRWPGLGLVAAGAVPVVSLALVVAGYERAHSAVSERQADLAAVQAKVAALSPATLGASGDADAQLAGIRAARTTALTAALATQTAWDVTLENLARVLPDDVWLTALNLQAPISTEAGAAADTGTSQGFTLSGTTSSERSVALVLQRLALLPSFTGIRLVTATSGPSAGNGTAGAGTATGTGSGKNLVQFQITGSVQGGSTTP